MDYVISALLGYGLGSLNPAYFIELAEKDTPMLRLRWMTRMNTITVLTSKGSAENIPKSIHEGAAKA